MTIPLPRPPFLQPRPSPRSSQVMLDTSGHSELSDYVRIVVFNISDPFAKAPVDARAWHNRRSFGGVETSPGGRGSVAEGVGSGLGRHSRCKSWVEACGAVVCGSCGA
eukprot:334857-Chlamydomonas_euryale.AAC.11